MNRDSLTCTQDMLTATHAHTAFGTHPRSKGCVHVYPYYYTWLQWILTASYASVYIERYIYMKRDKYTWKEKYAHENRYMHMKRDSLTYPQDVLTAHAHTTTHMHSLHYTCTHYITRLCVYVERYNMRRDIYTERHIHMKRDM